MMVEGVASDFMRLFVAVNIKQSWPHVSGQPQHDCNVLNLASF